MDSQTKLLASVQQVRELIDMLENAIGNSHESGETEFVEIVLEQLAHNGPWRLVIGIDPTSKAKE